MFREKENLIKDKTYAFSIRIVRMVQYLREEKKEFILSKQILRSGTSICALIHESEYAQSPADFINKLSISLKEANETKYWLSLLKDTEYITTDIYESLNADVISILKILIQSIKTLKDNLVER